MMFPNFQMPFNFMNGNGQQKDQNNCNFPFQFPFFPMQFMNQQPQQGEQQNANPFPFQFPFFPMQFMNQQPQQGEQQQNANPFPFQFPFFPMQFMNQQPQQGEQQQNANPFPFFPMQFMNQQPQQGEQQNANPFPFQFPFFPMQFMNQQPQQGEQQQNANPFPFFNFKLQNLDLQKLLSMEASPKTMEMLQKAMDFIFELYNKQCEAQSAKQNDEQSSAKDSSAEEPKQE